MQNGVSRRWSLWCGMLCLICGLSLVGGLVETAQAQSKQSLLRSSLFDSLVESSGPSVIRIQRDGLPLAYGTAVDAEGLLVTKASLVLQNRPASGSSSDAANDSPVLQEIQCNFNDNYYEARLVAVDSKCDLALLHIDCQLEPVEWAASDEPPRSGQIVVSLNHKSAIAVGVVGVDRQNVGNGRRMARFNVRDNDRADFTTVIAGLQTRPNFRGDGIVIRRLSNGTPASEAGLQTDDVIQSINGNEVNYSSAMRRVLSKLKPGDWVDLNVQRGSQELQLRVKLSQGEARSSNNNDQIDKWGGGEFSDIRFDFGQVITHDSPIQPQQCGGPIFNTDGKAMGVNIARALRVASFAIPAGKIQEFVEQNRIRETGR